MQDENAKKYHGYIVLSRQSILMQQVLGISLFGFYTALAMYARWSRKDVKNFGKILMTQAELARELNMDQGTISRKIKELNNRNRYCVIKHKDSIMLGYFPLFVSEVASKLSGKNYATLHELYADMHRINAELQENYAISQDKQAQNKVLKLNRSSNDNVSFSDDTNGYSDVIDNDEIDEGIEKMKQVKEGWQ